MPLRYPDAASKHVIALEATPSVGWLEPIRRDAIHPRIPVVTIGPRDEYPWPTS